MKASKSQPRFSVSFPADVPLRSVSLQIRDYQVTVKVRTAVPSAKPQFSR